MGRTMDHITVAGRPEPIPASEVAARLLRQRLETVREERGADAADALEALIGARLGTLLEEGKPSIDVANMKRSEEHTSELQSRGQLVCRLLLEKKKTTQ